MWRVLDLPGCYSRVSRGTWLAVDRPVCCLTLVWLAAFHGEALGQVAKEYDLKAVLLYNLTQFVEWPASVFPDQEPLIIGVLGRDPFGPALESVTVDRTAKERPIVVERYRATEAAQRCHILFVCASEASNVRRLLASFRGKPVLTVSDIDNFAERGGMVQFYRGPDNKIRIKVNRDATKASGLSVSAKLLRVADVISSPGK